MGKWAGKYVIGLTGNIGTGKSVVRRMLEHLGAYGIDADALSHRALAKGAPGYQQTVETFGRWIVGPDGEINRARLGKIVFADKEALVMLESIVHPMVLQAIDWMVTKSIQPVIVIEAIKLLESGISKVCDSVWVVYSPPDIQLNRLITKRGMAEGDARQRIIAQPPQEQKMKAAKVVIQNSGTFEDTWKQVMGAWNKFVPSPEAASAPAPEKPVSKLSQGVMTVVRGRPKDSEAIAGLINRVRKTGQPVTKGDIMEAFGDKAFLLVKLGDQLVGVAGWQVENLVARTADIILDPQISMEQMLPPLINEMERASRDLQCEASLVFTQPELSTTNLWQGLGYDRRTPQNLGVAVWQEAAAESLKPGQVMFFKQLRVDRVLRPI